MKLGQYLWNFVCPWKNLFYPVPWIKTYHWSQVWRGRRLIPPFYTLLKLNPPSSLDYRAHHRHPIILLLFFGSTKCSVDCLVCNNENTKYQVLLKGGSEGNRRIYLVVTHFTFSRGIQKLHRQEFCLFCPPKYFPFKTFLIVDIYSTTHAPDLIIF